MISINEYLKNPCGTASIPYWKYKNINIPDSMRIVHERFFSVSEFSGFNDEPYFRLYHNLENIKQFQQSEYEIIFGIADITFFVQLINECYSDLAVTVEQMESCCKSPVFSPDLWLLVKEKGTGKIVGGGIADFDREACEGILEWIQVLPAYRRLGIGKMIVNNLLSRMQNKAKFATVSGKVNNPTNPEILYRKCGFTGNDVWHILTIK